MPRRSIVIAVLVVAALLGGLFAPPAGAAAAVAPKAGASASGDLPVVRYQPPVAGPIVDRFDLPAKRWQPGNRGIDYDPAPETPITAAADGKVVFAGPVAGALHVTVEHADGLRTSYSFLTGVSVRRGQQVRAGDVVGTAGGPIHFGVRTPDGTYLDPEALLAGTLHPHVRLVPGAGEGLTALGSERNWLMDTLVNTGKAAATFAAEKGGDWIEIAAHYAQELNPITHIARGVEAMVVWGRQQLDCTSRSTPAPRPKERRIVVVVSGLGTGSEGNNSAWQIDTTTLGYANSDVVRYSYTGGRAPGPGTRGPDAVSGDDLRHDDPSSLEDIAVREFSKQDSQQDLRRSADELADLLADVAEAEPGVPIDVIAHSQGGVVSRLAVVEAGAEGRLPESVENLVTIGSPHQGAPLATGAYTLQQTPGGRAILDGAQGKGPFADLDDQLPAIPQLREPSPVLDEMRALPVPDNVRFTSIGSSGDMIVPGTVTADPKADNHVLIPMTPSLEAHGDLATDPRTTREVALAVAGAGPTCQGMGEATVAFWQAESIRNGETLAALGIESVAAGPLGSAAGAAGESGG